MIENLNPLKEKIKRRASHRNLLKRIVNEEFLVKNQGNTKTENSNKYQLRNRARENRTNFKAKEEKLYEISESIEGFFGLVTTLNSDFIESKNQIIEKNSELSMEKYSTSSKKNYSWKKLLKYVKKEYESSSSKIMLPPAKSTTVSSNGENQNDDCFIYEPVKKIDSGNLIKNMQNLYNKNPILNIQNQFNQNNCNLFNPFQNLNPINMPFNTNTLPLLMNQGFSYPNFMNFPNPLSNTQSTPYIPNMLLNQYNNNNSNLMNILNAKEIFQMNMLKMLKNNNSSAAQPFDLNLNLEMLLKNSQNFNFMPNSEVFKSIISRGGVHL